MKESLCQQNLLQAKIIQQGLLPKKRHFDRIFSDYFTLYLPQNQISGDFYWIGRKGSYKYIVVGDCVGHGVSASLISVLALNLFEYTIMNKGFKMPNKILKEVDKRFSESFTSNDINKTDTPWIELALLSINDKKKKVYFSSAKRKIIHISDNQNDMYKGSNYPIGGWQIEENREFEVIKFNFKKGDLIYLGSDGFQDQFGGKMQKKYKSKNLHNLLIKNSSFPLKIQQQKLHDEFLNWKGDNEQVDDVCIVGIEL